MRRLFSFALAGMLLFSGCGAKRFQPEMLSAQYGNALARATVTAVTHGGYYAEYRLSAEELEEGTYVTVLAPQSVAGIEAICGDDGVSISYADISLDAMTPEAPGFTPVDAFPWLLRDLREGYPANWGKQSENGREGIVLQYIQDFPDGTQGMKKVVLSADMLEPISAELYLDGRLILTVNIEEFLLTARKPVATAPDP
ncbi:MAG: hypothetical protein IJT76_00810 [Clostridia bacterium]|nr:hypothetical protein [Clostridia bacterium]